LALGLFCLLLPASAAAQDDDIGEAAFIPDSVFVQKQRAPIPYMTNYDRNLSRGAWLQSLSYGLQTRRIVFNASGSATTVDGLRGLSTDGLEAGVQGSLTYRATRRWLWALDGTFASVSQDDDRSSTDQTRNRLQLRTQYTVNPIRNVTASALVFGELQQSQSLGDQNIPNTVYAKHAGRDSSHTSGTKSGASGNFTWRPVKTLEVRSSAGMNRFRQVTNTLRRDLFIDGPGGADSTADSTTTSKTPNADERFESSFRFTGVRGLDATLVAKGSESDQEYYVLVRRGTERASYARKSLGLTATHAVSPALLFQLGASAGQSSRTFELQTNLRGRQRTLSGGAGVNLNRLDSRASARFDVGRSENDQQQSQNGTTISRTLNVSGMRRISRRLWMDVNGAASLLSRSYVDNAGDRDDARGYANVGGGYLVSPRCSTAVHFSVNRTHAVAIQAPSSGLNNVQTVYQMDANLKLRVTNTFTVTQFYLLNANYFIYDYDEQRNSLTRIRRIDTILADSLFQFAFLRLNHNFFFQDRGAYTRPSEGADRTYRVAQESYAQNLSVTVGVSPLGGVTFLATQSLSNTRNYFPNAALNSNRNRWNLNLGMDVTRSLPGAMSIQGSVQRIDEYTEGRDGGPVLDPIGYWIAGVTFTKDF
jgi:hypothetical protein